ncbi:hypothetical protein BBNG_00971 [Bifidobacterium bifidum NCIMB 41171]|nr:hypothetical protein BBNG_00971 [Bifidobacterium bifidum NCIMB 41171]
MLSVFVEVQPSIIANTCRLAVRVLAQGCLGVVIPADHKPFRPRGRWPGNLTNPNVYGDVAMTADQ